MDSTPLDFSNQNHRRLIGWLGLLLPVLILTVSRVWHPANAVESGIRGSVSAYYYTSAIGVFVGVLFALSLFLLTYQGYTDVSYDRLVGKWGGLSAVGVAVFPTASVVTGGEPAWWAPWMKHAHYVSAVSLFVSFIVFALWLFRRSSTPAGVTRAPGKINRDRIYLACGLAMSASLVWALVAGQQGGSIFLPESIAIVAFALSWLVKGEAHEPFVAVAMKLMGRV